MVLCSGSGCLETFETNGLEVRTLTYTPGTGHLSHRDLVYTSSTSLLHPLQVCLVAK